MSDQTVQLTKSGKEVNGHFATQQFNGVHGQDEPQSEAGCYVSEELYWQKYYEHLDFNYEWNNGILEEKPMADVRNAAMYQWLLVLLRAYLEVHPVAQLVNLEIGFRLALKKKTTIRKPDLFVVRYDNPTPLTALDRNYRGICDLCIESISDSTKGEINRDIKTKKAEYEGVGVREYYILDASGTHMHFYQRASNGDYVPIPPVDEDLIRSAVLPGFQFRIRDLHRQPTLIELAEEETYQGFVLPAYQAAKARAAQEWNRAERLAAKLRALGLTEEELEN